ncbi:hypothetical protein PSGK_19145 [Pseudomonas solani]|uniref:hypothetical protein n=1 Tax=Pseudomonas solani TaxID=2731552 RepID=UPI0035BE405F
MEGINLTPSVTSSPYFSTAHPNPPLAALLCRLLKVIRYASPRDALSAVVRFRQLLLLFRVAGRLDAAQAFRLTALVDNALYLGTREALHRARANVLARHQSPSVKDR